MRRARWWWLSLVLLGSGCDPSSGVPPVDAGPGDAGAGADAALSDAAIPDAGPPAPEGEPCGSNAECASGYCVDAAGTGGICTRECGAGCPTDWTCRDVDVGGETRMLCVPLLGDHCIRCASDAECVGGACLALDGALHCAPRCATDAACPTGYRCAAASDREGTFCQPVSGSCSCDEAMAGATRTCLSENAIGTCWGMQTCAPATGWSACDAREAAAETCDGTDEDCDFAIDDGVDSGAACEITVAGVGTCMGVEVCGGASGVRCQGQTPTAEICNYIDDDCDGTPDEGFTTVGDVCETGVGACFAFGAIRCAPDGSGPECSAVAGTPGAELCNNRDDDCDGSSDEDFPTVGDGCSSGLGACERFGTVVCRADETDSECSATPGTGGVETCNYVDDDCNGTADDAFRDAATGLYDSNTTCGSCDIDCTTLFAGAPNASGACSIASGRALCVLGCDAGAFDLNGSALDGCEFLLDSDVVYVSRIAATAADDAGCGLGPAGTGAGNYPCRSIGQGLAQAAALGRGAVWVSDGNYDEAVTLRDGIDLLGGYRADTWERVADVTATVIQGVSTVGAHQRTVIAQSITSPTVFEGFIVQGPFNARPSGNSYAVYVSGSPGLTLRGNFVYAGRGGSGGAGSLGVNGTAGASGVGRSSSPADYDARVATGSGTCNASNDRAFANGGATTCGTDDVRGGDGGGVHCPPAQSRIQQSASNGGAGQPGSPGGGAGLPGSGGHDGEMLLIAAGYACLVPSGGPLFGQDGGNGSRGTDAGAVAGCASPDGSVVAGHWFGGTGTSGAAGTPGGGGGGGGAGGGGYCTACPEGKHRLGGVGGGGGAGGCGGAGGVGGGPGGGAFGIFVIGPGAPTLRDNLVLLGDGGAGGRGGQGGAGGFGGLGAQGGVEMQCGGRGGRGGDGGDGGHGSGGGGGCGGASFGIYTSGIGSPGYCGAASGNTLSGGSAGPAGSGGLSPGAAGGAGTAGSIATCRFD